nr:hypothetical protein [Tanacetum cinerariifolium]
MLGSIDCANNHINVSDNSPLFDDLLNDTALVVPYVVANDAKHAYFKKRQEGARKGVERVFGVLQGRWGIIQQPARSYHVNTLRRVMYSCIILRNMILKDQKMAVFDWNEVYANPTRNMQRTWIERCETQRRKNKETRDRDTHKNKSLKKNDLLDMLLPRILRRDSLEYDRHQGRVVSRRHCDDRDYRDRSEPSP